MKLLRSVVIGLLSIVFMASCAAEAPAPGPWADAAEIFAFVNVNVIPMDSERVLEGRTVVVAGGRVGFIGEEADARLPDHAVRIDSSGRYLIPALSDMHVHLEGAAWNAMFPPEGQFSEEELDFADLLFPYVANGVATVQVMSALPEHVELRERIARGDLLGPRLVLARMIDAPGKAWPPPISSWVGSPAEARQAVLDAHQAGYDRMKAYSFLDRDSYAAIIETAAELGMGVGGHIPSGMSLEEVVAGGQDLIAHSEEVMKAVAGDYSRERIDESARAIADGGVWFTPTLTTSRNILAVLEDYDRELERPEMRYLHPMDRGIWSFINANLYQPIPAEHRRAIRDGFEQFQLPLTRALGEVGARLMIGTDALIPSTVPGFSIHDELAEFVDVGLTPYQALRASTTEPFAFLGELDRAGTIEVGKRADLVLLGGNPLDDITATRRINGVVIGGRWVSGDEIEQGLNRLAAANRSN